MANIDFPASPLVNDEYTFSGKTWIWNGSGWIIKSTDVLKLDQTTPQTITDGVPLMTTAVNGAGSANQLVNKAYVDLAVASLHLTEHLSGVDLSPDVGTFLKMTNTVAAAGTVQSVNITGTIGSPTAIFKWLTPAGEPHLDRIPAGTFDIHAHLLKTTTAPNNKIVAIYAEIWQNDAAGAHTAKIATSSTYQGFTTSNTFYDIYATVATEFPLAVTDRISIEFFGYVISGLGENKLTMTVGGTSDSHMEIDISSAELENIFVVKTRTITATAPLTIAGTTSADLSADRTLAISAATAAVPGSMSAADFTKLAALSMRNIIINGGFTVNQRAYVSAAALAAGIYGHDRWKAGSGGGDYSFTQLSSNTTVTIAANKTLIHVVEAYNVQATAYVLSWTGTVQARYAVNSATPGGAYAASPILITGQTVGTVMSVQFGNGASAGTLGNVQLEPGAIVTPFERRLYQQELSLCQRYCFSPYGAEASAVIGQGMAWSTTNANILIIMPVQMRTKPTVVLTAGDWRLLDPSTAYYDVTAAVIDNGGPNAVTLNCTVASGLTSTRQYVLVPDTSVPRLMYFQCEL